MCPRSRLPTATMFVQNLARVNHEEWFYFKIVVWYWINSVRSRIRCVVVGWRRYFVVLFWFVLFLFGSCCCAPFLFLVLLRYLVVLLFFTSNASCPDSSDSNHRRRCLVGCTFDEFVAVVVVVLLCVPGCGCGFLFLVVAAKAWIAISSSFGYYISIIFRIGCRICTDLSRSLENYGPLVRGGGGCEGCSPPGRKSAGKRNCVVQKTGQ